MIRSVAIIAVAIRLSNPAVSEPTAERYAKVIREEAREHHFDPYTMASIVSHESAWNPRADNGSDFGLCQINIVNLPACRAGRESAECSAAIERMKNPAHNLRTCAGIITTTRKYCRKFKRSRHAWFPEWLAQFQGRSPKGTRCLWTIARPRRKVRPHRYTTAVIAYRRCLIREIARGVRPGRGKFRCQSWYGKG